MCKNVHWSNAWNWEKSEITEYSPRGKMIQCIFVYWKLCGKVTWTLHILKHMQHTGTYANTFICVSRGRHICKHTQTHESTQTYTWSHTCKYTHTNTHVNIWTTRHTGIDMYAHTCMHACFLTHNTIMPQWTHFKFKNSKSKYTQTAKYHSLA